MKETYDAYVPRDRLLALASASDLPKQSTGSVLFADISGFTPLTEAYEAHLGSRLGGEELTRVLNQVYAMLIGEVDARRGSVIGFAGDAITCWFDGDPGALAVGCALGMQSGMEQFTAIPSPGGGTIALGLKAAVTSGKVKRFAVGDEAIQKVDVLAGEPVYRVAVVEGLAERGDVLIDQQTKEQLGESAVLGEACEDGQSGVKAWKVNGIKDSPSPESWPPLGFLEVEPGLVVPWIMSAIRKRIASGMGEFFTELRPATAMFVKFEGIDFEEDAAADDKLDAFFSWVQVIVNEYEGVVHQLTVGDKGSFLYAAFGAPISHEDDTLRAMAAALEIRSLADNLDYISGVRIGIGRGSTRTGAYGGPTRRTYGVLGDQVNLSARLMGKAEPGEILVSDSAYKEGKRSYSLLTLPPIRVKGKSEPVTVHRLQGKVDHSPDARTGDAYALPMIGRKEELARIGGLLNRAVEDFGQAATISADAGMGKSRLLLEAVKMAQKADFLVLHGECQTFGSNSPYNPWWRIWREFFGLKGNESPEEAISLLENQLGQIDERLLPRLPLLGPALDIEIEDNELTARFDAKLKRASLESLLIDCLRVRTGTQPVLVILEDAHAIDEVSRELLRTVIQAAARMPLLILAACRPKAEDPLLSPAETTLEYVHSIELGEFTEKESADLIQLKHIALYGAETTIPPEVVQKLINKTGGNPFFIEEVMNWMHQEKVALDSAAALDAADLPVSLYALVLSRMDQLNEAPRITMKVASVVGRVFQAAIVWGVYPELGGEGQVRSALAMLCEKEFTVPDEESEEIAYLFKHVVIHEVAYESLTKLVRANLHEAIGLFIENSYPSRKAQVLDLLAFHFGRSENREKKRQYLILAGDAARKAYANQAAADYYQSVLPLLEGPEKVPVMRHLGNALETGGDWNKAMETYKESLGLAESLQMALDAAHCRLAIGDLLRRKGEFEEAEHWFAAAGKSFSELDDAAGMGQVLHSSGTLAAQTGQNDKAIDLYSQSIEIRQRLGDELRVANLMSNIGIVLRFQGKFEEALEQQRKSLEVRQRFGDPLYLGNSYNNIGMVKRSTGDLAGAREDLIKALEHYEKVGDRSETANALNTLAEIALDQKDTEACEAYLLEALRLVRELGNMRSIAYIMETFAFNAVNLGKPDRCLRLFGAAKAVRDAIGAPLPEADSKRAAEAIDEAGTALPGVDLNSLVREGANLPLSTALDYAAGIEDADL
jgi:class 3 adenylate cyclase/tetratricopeptide (TPR) repeat protein